MSLQPFQIDLIELIIEHKVLEFGQFTLKSGRISPYFFNLGRLEAAAAIAKLCSLYTQAIQHQGIDFDIIFGPAYKGIPIAIGTALAWYEHTGVSKNVVYNRKEEKNHGEKGRLVGKVAHQKVLLLDDVITAGTAVREALLQLQAANAKPIGLMVALNREEKDHEDQNTIQKLELEYQIPVHSIITFSNLLEYLKVTGNAEQWQSLHDYREKYGT